MPIAVPLPELGENITTSVVIKILVNVGETLEKDQSLLELETDKAVFEVPSPMAGKVEAIHIKEGDEIKVGQLILTLAGQGSEQTPQPLPTTEKKQVSSNSYNTRNVPQYLSPTARRQLQEQGLPSDQIPTQAVTTTPLPDFSQWGEIQRKPMSMIRKTTAQRMTLAWTTIPQVTQFDEADITKLESLRKQAPGTITLTPIITKVVAEALSQFPQFNASIDMASQEIIYKEYIHVGIAVDTERGLVVPVIKNADQKSIASIAQELTTLSEKARNKKITIEEMQGGNFSITNLGSLGVGPFTPIVNPPEVAVLGLGRGKAKDSVQLPLSLSYDHRLIDGADAARFIRWIIERLENPTQLNLD
jgi:pyruvate dehydrogenase E2 component (dihydrolipoamide acetyltransferase)